MAQRVSAMPMSAGRVTAGKSRGMAEAAQMPTATSQKWNRACADSHRVAAAHRPMRRSAFTRPTMKAAPSSSWMMPMSRTKC